MTVKHTVGFWGTVPLVTAVSISAAWAGDLPSGGVVTAGSATIGADGTTGLVIDQSSDKAIIEWNSFSIGAGHRTDFHNGNGATLNRVTGGDLSAIYGTLTATGSVYLINPNGVIGGVIETGGSFVASTHDVADQDFLDGGDLTFSGNAEAVLVNMGSVSSLGGNVGFIARTIVNEGTLSAPEGTVGLAAGREVLLRDAALDDGRFLVKVGETSDSVTEQGMIEAAAVELKANGGNVYALAGNGGGTINATGVTRTADGRVLLTAGDGSVTVEKAITATRQTTAETDSGPTTAHEGGEIILNANEVSVAGLLDVSGTDGAGGRIDIGAAHAISLNGASLDASGDSTGGTVRVGGEFQGGDTLAEDEVANVQHLTMDAASRIDASASSGDGGTVVLWSETRTDFQGSIQATGGTDGAGGAVEVSSRGALSFAGTVDTGGGTLLLDPTDVEIGTSNTTGATSFIATTAVETALASNSVVITSHGSDGDDGDITWSADLAYDSANDLSLLAHGDINFKASLQNENAVGGDVNLVAGWDGAGGLGGSVGGGMQTDLTFDATGFDSATLSPGGGLFGRTSGSLLIGDGNQSSGIAVGSRAGATRVYAHDLTLTAGSVTGAYAQLGYQASVAGDAYAVTGDMALRLTGDLTLQGGSEWFAYAQVGHLGAGTAYTNDIDAVVTDADITVEALGDLTLTASSQTQTMTPYAQIGHGGLHVSADISGDITIVSARDLTLETGSGSDYSAAQIGHGGTFAQGSYEGDITLTAVRDVTLTGGTGQINYTQIGHGSRISSGTISGDISIASARDLTLKGGSAYTGYAQLGHAIGGTGSGAISGDISIASAQDLTLQGGTDTAAFAQIGHGGDANADSLEGDIYVSLSGEFSQQAGTVATAHAALGHACDDSDAVTSTTFVRAAAFDQDVSTSVATDGTGTSVISGSLIGNALQGGPVTVAVTAATDILWSEGFTYDSANDLTLMAQGDILFSASLQNTNDTGGDINLVAGWDGLTDIDVSVFDAETLSTTTVFGQNGGRVLIGDGSQTSGIAVGSRSGTTRVYTHDLTLTGGSADDAYAQLGYQVTNAGTAHTVTGDIALRLSGDLTAQSGSAGYTYAQVGHLGANTSDDTIIDATITEADITVEVQGDLTLEGGSRYAAYAQLGHGGYDTDGDVSGDITVTGDGTLTLEGGSAQSAYAQLGHGGEAAEGGLEGNITIVSAQDLTITGGSAYLSYAQLGHGGTTATSTIVGDIAIDSVQDLTLQGGSEDGNYAYAQVGHGGVYSSGNIVGGITVASARNLALTSGAGPVNFARFGHGGFTTKANISGDITITSVEDLSITGGSSDQSFAQLGHGGYGNESNISGDITIASAQDLTITGGSANSSYAQLGHGGVNNKGNASGTIAIASVRDLTVQGGEGEDDEDGLGGAYGRLGHGGKNSVGDLSGDIIVDSARTVTVQGRHGAGAYAQFGHGGKNVTGDFSGDIALSVAEDITVQAGTGVNTWAQIGHGGLGNTGDHSGDITVSARNLTIESGSQNFAYAQLGHGMARYYVYENTGTRQGDIFVSLTGELSLPKGTGKDVQSWIGHYSNSDNAISNADLFVRAAAFDRDASTQIATDGTGTGVLSAFMIANALEGGSVTVIATDSSLRIDGMATYDSEHTLGLLSAYNLEFKDRGYDPRVDEPMLANVNDTAGDIILVAGYNTAHTAWTADPDDPSTWAVDTAVFDAEDLSTTTLFAQNGGSVIIGDANQVYGVAVGSRSGTTGVYAHDLTLTGGTDRFALAQLGYTTSNEPPYTITGDITVRLTGDLTLQGGRDYASYAQVGHLGTPISGISNVAGTVTGADITVEALGGLTLSALGGVYNKASYAQIGHGGAFAVADISGDITVTAGQGATLKGAAGGNSYQAYAQIGHGSADFGSLDQYSQDNQATGTRQGDISVSLGGELSLEDGTGGASYAWLGHASGDSDALSNADITVTATGIDTDAATALASGADGNLSADILSNALTGGDVSITVTDTGLSQGGTISQTSDHDLTLIAAHDITLASGASISSTGNGTVVLAAGGDFHNDSGSTTPITVGGGRWLVYSTRPDHNRDDIEITNRDFLRYGLTFDPADPVPASLTSGSGLIYSVTPVLTLTAQDQSIDEGDSPDDTALTASLSVGGAAVDADAFGIDTSTAQVHLAGSVATAAGGTPRPGTWAGGLEVDPTYSTWSGVTLTRDSGDLTVTGTPGQDDAVVQNRPVSYSEDPSWQTFTPPRQASCAMSGGTASCLDTSKLEQ